MGMFAPEGFDPSMIEADPAMMDPFAEDFGAEEEAPSSPVDVLREMFQLAQDYLAVEQDEEDKEKGAKILASIQQLLALNQKQQDEMMGASPAAKALRKSYN